MSNAARVLDLDAFRRRREASRATVSLAPTAPTVATPSGAPASGWSAGAAPVAWAPFYVWMPVLMVLG